MWAPIVVFVVFCIVRVSFFPLILGKSLRKYPCHHGIFGGGFPDGCWTKHRGGKFPPNHPFVHRVFHYFHHPFWGNYTYVWVDTHFVLWKGIAISKSDQLGSSTKLANQLVKLTDDLTSPTDESLGTEGRRKTPPKMCRQSHLHTNLFNGAKFHLQKPRWWADCEWWTG